MSASAGTSPEGTRGARGNAPREGAARPDRSRRVAGTARARLTTDRLGRIAVSIGGFAIIASILGILVFILVETVPLARGARVVAAPAAAWPGSEGAAILGDEYRSTAVTLGPDGVVRRGPLSGGASEEVGPTFAAAEPPALPLERIAVAPGHPVFTGATRDGRVLVVPVQWETSFEGGVRRTAPSLGAQALLELDPARRPLGAFAATSSADGSTAAVGQLADGTIVVVRRAVETNAITGASTASVARHELPSPRPVSALALDADARRVWAGTSDGAIVTWPLKDGVPGPPVAVGAGGSPVTALSLLIGHRALVVGQADGSLSIWFLVRQEDGSFRPARVRDFDRHPGAIVRIAPSPRDKGFLAIDGSGRMGLYYSTSHRTMWTGPSPVPSATGLYYLPKADGALVAGGGRVCLVAIDNPHPEVSLEALFGRVWYEGYDTAEYVWQSSSGTDDFEPKLSLTPLLYGTLKGTIYSLLLAIPIGVLGAMYTSQFMHASLRKIVKPVVEIMAALPSVVLGFLAGLWLAPRLEKWFPALILMAVILPAMSIAAAMSYGALPRAVRRRLPSGSEALGAILFLAAGAWIAVLIEPAFERLVFGGRFQTWLSDATGLGFDQRNAVVVGLAMGFAVIPIIFSVAEEAFSNVPRGLVAGSLALGASRWQTVTRVVLPSASPGIFSAIMIGFGRAVGETMIVLMATGNTPIMDWNPFNGFRTLSANIAVEIPEAPHGGTLYRTLFLAGLLLFVLTFIVNTLAEVVRQNLRRRYANL